jgi:hypothetical protein
MKLERTLLPFVNKPKGFGFLHKGKIRTSVFKKDAPDCMNPERITSEGTHLSIQPFMAS